MFVSVACSLYPTIIQYKVFFILIYLGLKFKIKQICVLSGKDLGNIIHEHQQIGNNLASFLPDCPR